MSNMLKCQFKKIRPCLGRSGNSYISEDDATQNTNNIVSSPEQPRKRTNILWLLFLYPFPFTQYRRKDDNMWLEKNKNGTFKAIERYVDPLTGESHRATVTMLKDTARQRKEAQAALARKIAQKQAQKVTPQKITLEDLISEHRIYQAENVRPSTQRRDFYNGNTFMDIFGKNTLVNKMSARSIRKALQASGREPSTCNELIGRFKTLLRWGYNNDFIDDISYLSKIKPFRVEQTHREKIEDKYLESYEAVRLLAAMDVTYWKDLTTFLIKSGLRPGEALDLSYTDIDIENRYIHVTSTWDINNKLSGPPKSPASDRDVYIQDDFLPLCKKLKSQALTFYLTTRCDVVFQDNGKPLTYAAYRKYLGIYTERVVGRKLTPHAMRHTHTSLLAENRVPLDVIVRRLGHEDSEITKRIYLHVTKKMKERDNEAIRQIHVI